MGRWGRPGGQRWSAGPASASGEGQRLSPRAWLRDRKERARPHCRSLHTPEQDKTDREESVAGLRSLN